MPKKRFLYFICLVLLLFSLCACEEEDDSNGNKRRKNDYSGTETPTPTAETKTVSPTSQITVEPIETSPTPTDNAWPTMTPVPTQSIRIEDMLSTHLQRLCERSDIPKVEYEGEPSFEDLGEKGISTEKEWKAWASSSNPDIIKGFLEHYYHNKIQEVLLGYDYDHDIQRKIVDLQDHYLVAATVDHYNREQNVFFCCISFNDSISAEEIYNAIVEVCFEIPGEGSSEEARIPWTRYFHSNEGARAITCDMDDGHTFFVCLKGNEIVLSQSDGKELFVNEICSACDMPSPFGKDGGDKNECDAKKVVQLLYNELIPGGFSERVYNLIYPNDVYVIQKAKSNAQTKADIWDYGFDLFDFSVEQYRGFCDEYESGCFAMFPNVVLCEDAYNPIKTNQLLNGDNKPGTDAYHDYTLSKDWFFGDEGASVYVLVVEWGYMKEGFDHIGFLNENNREPYYDEFDVHGRDVVWVYRYNGRWYVAGKIFGFDTYAVEMD